MEYNKTLANHADAAMSRNGVVTAGLPPEAISITKGLPTPHRGRAKYPFRDMEVGDSFFAPHASVIGLHGCARRHRPKRFTCRSLVENGVAGVRVWRTQ